jgi:hypothetical protein
MLLLGASLLVLAACGRSRPLDAAEVRAELAALFERGLKNTAPDVAAAKAQYARAKTALPGDPRIDYAYGLVLLNQRRYADAVPLVDKYAATNPGDRQAARVRLWALVQARRYTAALEAAVDFASRLPRDPALQQADHDDVRYLGNLFGYLDAVRPPTLDLSIKADRTNELLALLGNARLPHFDLGRREVADRFTVMKGELVAAAERRARESQDQRQALAGDFSDAQADLARGADSMEESRQKGSDAQRSLSVLWQQLSSLSQERARLGAQMVFIQGQLSALQATRQATIVDPSFNDSTGERSNRTYVDGAGNEVRWVAGQEFKNRLGETFRFLPGENYSTTSTRVRTEDMMHGYLLGQRLATLNLHAVELDKRILALRAAGGNALAQRERESKALVTSEAAIRQAERRAASLEKQLRRLETAPPPSAAATTAEMKRLATYLPLPYEQESKRILGWFGK